MKLILEGPMMIDGINSWFRCLERHEVISAGSIPEKYHYHDYIEVLYAFDSDGYVWINGEKVRYDTGTLIVINPKEPHALTFESPSHHLCVHFSPHILYSDEKAFYEFKYVAPFLLENVRRYIFKDEDLSNINTRVLAEEILKEWNTKGEAYELVVRSNILKLFSGIFRYWAKNDELHYEKEISDTMKKVLAYVSENYRTLTQTEVAEHCNISYQYLSRLFKEAVGRGFNEYVNFFRLREAEKLLLSSDKDVTEIALECGFTSASYFIEKFKKQKGITPKQFREKMIRN